MTSTTPQDSRVANALSAESSSIRLQAALAIGSGVDADYTELLVERCAIEPDFFVRDMLSWAPTRLPSEIVLPRLHRELDSGCNQARSQALHTLSKIGDKSTWPWITREMLGDPDDGIARTAWRTAVVLVPEDEKASLAEELTRQLGRGDRSVQLSLSRALIDLGEFALDLRRPLPPEPRAAGRLGTVFHDAVAQRLSARGTLFDLAEAGVPDGLDPRDRARIERWLETAENLPLLEDYVLAETETEREITIGATTLRCRMDAVFRRLDGSGWLIVDWKTGRRQVPVDQLSVYVHAWAASQGVSAGSVRAAYVYVDYPGGRVDELAAAGLLSLDRIESALTPGLSSDEMTHLPPPEQPG